MLRFAMTVVRDAMTVVSDVAAAIADGLDVAIDMCWPVAGAERAAAADTFGPMPVGTRYYQKGQKGGYRVLGADGMWEWHDSAEDEPA